MSHTLIQIGNSSAIIIPARIIKKRKYTSKTEFEIIETTDGLKLVHKFTPPENLVFPKYEASDEDIPEVVARMNGIVNLSKDEIEADDRLKHITSR